MGTDAPVAADDEVTLSRYAVQYDVTDTSEPTDLHFTEAEGVTVSYIDQFMKSFFEFSDEVTVDTVTVTPVARSTSPLQLEYETTIEFSPESLLIPSTAELDSLLLTAFQEPSVSTLLILLGNLPAENPFATSQGASYIMVPGTRSAVPLPPSQTSMSKLGVGAIAAFSSLLVGILGVFVVRHLSRKTDGLYRYKPAPGTEGPPIASASEKMDSTSVDTHTNGSENPGAYGQFDDPGEEVIDFGSATEQKQMLDPLFQPQIDGQFISR